MSYIRELAEHLGKLSGINFALQDGFVVGPGDVPFDGPMPAEPTALLRRARDRSGLSLRIEDTVVFIRIDDISNESVGALADMVDYEAERVENLQSSIDALRKISGVDFEWDQKYKLLVTRQPHGTAIPEVLGHMENEQLIEAQAITDDSGEAWIILDSDAERLNRRVSMMATPITPKPKAPPPGTPPKGGLPGFSDN